MFRWVLIGGSLLAHGGLVVLLGVIRAPVTHAATSIEVTETKKDLPPPPPPKVETPAPVQKRAEAPQNRQRAKAAEPKPADTLPKPGAAPKLGDLPDLGLELSGGNGPPLGLPPAVNTAPASRATAPMAKTLQAPPPPKEADACSEAAGKPKLLRLPQPAYTEAARAAGVEGKVRVEITVDESGRVAGVRVLSALGHGLDEAALAAARAASFQAATRCGKPVRSTFTVSIRFSAS
jgi:protein TonB